MKIALVTGAGHGLGQGFVQALDALGYHVYAGVHSDAPAENSKTITYLKLDVTDDASIGQVISRIRNEQGKLHLVVNNAGVNKRTATDGHPEKANRLDALDRQMLRTMFDVNAVSPILIARDAVPLMTEPSSFIINISSERASFSNADKAGNYGYRASKVALNMLTQSLLFDLPKTVATFAVHPGWVLTAMNPQGVLQPEEAARKILDILEHWRPELNGRFLNNDGQIWAEL